MKIGRVRAHRLMNIPIQPPPFRKLPNVEKAIMVEIETDDGLIGWAMGGYAHPVIVDFINKNVAPELVGEDPLLIERIMLKLAKSFIFVQRDLGRALVSGLAMIDIALWDIKGKALGINCWGGRPTTGSAHTPASSSLTGASRSTSRCSSPPMNTPR